MPSAYYHYICGVDIIEIKNGQSKSYYTYTNRCIVIGQNKRTEVTGSSQSVHVYDVACIKIHEKYMIPVNGYGFDVALLKLARPAIFKPGQIWPACLPIQEQRVAIGKECFITGKSRMSTYPTLIAPEHLALGLTTVLQASVCYLMTLVHNRFLYIQAGVKRRSTPHFLTFYKKLRCQLSITTLAQRETSICQPRWTTQLWCVPGMVEIMWSVVAMVTVEDRLSAKSRVVGF